MSTLVFLEEDGTGLEGATSYASLDFADSFITLGSKNLEWLMLPSDSRKDLLMLASSLLDEQYRWKGIKTVPKSGLRFPRKGVVDRDGIPFPSDTIPSSLRKATSLLAFHLSKGEVLEGTPGAGLSRLKVDVIDIHFDQGTAEHPFPAKVRSLLGELGSLPSKRRFVQSEVY